MGVKDADVFDALFDRADELTARRWAVHEGLFSITVDAEGYPPEKIALSGPDLEAVRSTLLRAIEREEKEIHAGLHDQGVVFGGTITVSKDGTITWPADEPAQG